MSVPALVSPGVLMDAPDLNRIMARLSHAEQIRLLVSHPFFTGRCPNCRARVPLSQAKLAEAHCSHCGWEDLTLQRQLRDDSLTPNP